MFAGVSLLKTGKRSGGCERKEIPEESYITPPGAFVLLCFTSHLLVLLEERLHAALDADHVVDAVLGKCRLKSYSSRKR